MLGADAFVGLSITEALGRVLERYKLNPNPWVAPSWREPRLEILSSLLSNPITAEEAKALDHLGLNLAELDSVILWLQKDRHKPWESYWSGIQSMRATERKRARAQQLAEGTVLRSFAEAGNKEQVISLIAEGAAINSVDGLGRSSVYWAASKGYVDIVEILLEAGALAGGRKPPPLHAASYAGHIKIVAVLLERGANVDDRGFEDTTALHEAAKGGQAEMIRFLVNHGANLEAQCEYGTAMDVATHWGKPECIRVLSELGLPETKGRAFLPEHVFISFSARDRKTAEEIGKQLRESGIPVWIASSDLNPGMPDWEAAVRSAIKASFAVLLLASKDSSESVFVRGELSLAEASGVRIIPIWIKGDQWADCVPLGKTHGQYIDARDKGQSERFEEPIRFLGPLIKNATPSHHRVIPFWKIASPADGTGSRPVKPPPGFFSVAVTAPPQLPQDGGIGAFFSTAKYSSLHAFLDDLYVSYLRTRFEPFSYGRDWILREWNPFHDSLRLLAPWSALTGSGKLNTDPDERWLFHTSLTDCGLEPGATWEVVESIPKNVWGLAVNDKRIFDAVRNPSPKTASALWRDQIIVRSPIIDLGDRLPFRYVLSDNHSTAPIEQYLMIQTDRPVSEDKMNYLSRDDFESPW